MHFLISEIQRENELFVFTCAQKYIIIPLFKKVFYRYLVTKFFPIRLQYLNNFMNLIISGGLIGLNK